ncbi:MAG TPA: T9SS type A sorting domain-containing protein, partial [Chitinophagaceae bacterium]|nr:T9SS type A sorting domain-containing protein [Chitinophagaceae bacterium]
SRELKVYPNPSHTYFTLQIGSEIADQKISLRVLNLKGRVVETRNNLTTNQTLQLGNNYKPGVYIAEIWQGNKRRFVKLVKL